MGNPAPVDVLTALLQYETDVGPRERAEALFPEAEAAYIEEWTERFGKGLMAAVGTMTPETRERYVKQALGHERG